MSLAKLALIVVADCNGQRLHQLAAFAEFGELGRDRSQLLLGIVYKFAFPQNGYLYLTRKRHFFAKLIGDITR